LQGKEAVEDLRNELQLASTNVGDEMLMRLLSYNNADPRSSDAKAEVSYELCGQSVHRDCFCKLLGVSIGRLQKVKKMWKNGDGASAQVDLRSLNGKQSKPATEMVDAYLWTLWNHRAQALGQRKDENDKYFDPDGKVSDDEICDDHFLAAESDEDDHAETEVNVNALTLVSQLETRWLQHITRQELYEGYRAWCGMDSEFGMTLASKSTFRRVWLGGWKNVLRICPPSQHYKCKQCESFKGYLRQIAEEKEKASLLAAYRLHIQENNSDRLVRTRGLAASELSTSPESFMNVERTLLLWTIDGMDSAKYPCPRIAFKIPMQDQSEFQDAPNFKSK
jgi:hypothetical protein